MIFNRSFPRLKLECHHLQFLLLFIVVMVGIGCVL